MKSIGDISCSFCDSKIKATLNQGGEWHTSAGGAVCCCHRCAVDVLPRLMADSIRIGPVDSGYVEGGKVLKLAEGNFWKSMAARLSRRGG